MPRHKDTMVGTKVSITPDWRQSAPRLNRGDLKHWNKQATKLIKIVEPDEHLRTKSTEILSSFIKNRERGKDVLATILVYTCSPTGPLDVLRSSLPGIDDAVTQAVSDKGHVLQCLESVYRPYTTKNMNCGSAKIIKIMNSRCPNAPGEPLILKYFDLTLFDDKQKPIALFNSMLSDLNPVSALLFPACRTNGQVPRNAWFPGVVKHKQCLTAWFDYSFTAALCIWAISMVRDAESIQQGLRMELQEQNALLNLFKESAIFKQFSRVVNVVLEGGDTVLHKYFKEGKFDLAKCFIEQANNVGFGIDFELEDANKQTITACALACDAPEEILSLLTGDPRSSSP